MFIFLDDIRVPSDVTWVEIPRIKDWVIVRNFEEFQNEITKSKYKTSGPQHISFDHDLAEEHYSGDFSRAKSGYHCAQLTVQLAIANEWHNIPNFTIHSMNEIGSKRIKEAMKDFERYHQLVRRFN